MPFEAMRASGAERCFSGERRAYVAGYALIAAMSGWMPTMFMTRVRL